jgi:hypothetical protein
MRASLSWKRCWRARAWLRGKRYHLPQPLEIVWVAPDAVTDV